VASWAVGIAAVLVFVEMQSVTPSAQPQSVPGDQTKEDQDKKKDEHPGTSDKRLFGALPDFLTVENAAGLTP
jgi:hypothetical protein